MYTVAALGGRYTVIGYTCRLTAAVAARTAALAALYHGSTADSVPQRDD